MHKDPTFFHRTFAALGAAAMTLALFVSYFATPAVHTSAGMVA